MYSVVVISATLPFQPPVALMPKRLCDGVAPAPAGLVASLADHVAGRNARLARHSGRGLAVLVHKAGLTRASAGAAHGAGAAGGGQRIGQPCLLGRVVLHLFAELALDGFGQAAGQTRELHRELLVEQVGAQVGALAFHETRLLRGLAHALDELAHEERFKLFGRFLERGLVVAVLARSVPQRIERRGVGREAAVGQGIHRVHVRSPRVRRSWHRTP